MSRIYTYECQVEGNTVRKVIAERRPQLNCYHGETISYGEYLRRELHDDMYCRTSKGMSLPKHLLDNPKQLFLLAAGFVVCFLAVFSMPFFM